MKNKIVIDGVTYIREETEQKKFKSIFETTCIQDLFSFANENYADFLEKHSKLSEKKLNLEIVEKGIEILNQGWKATMNENQYWYYPYFKKTPDGFVFIRVDFGYYSGVGSSLVLETEKLAEHAGKILIENYNLFLKH